MFIQLNFIPKILPGPLPSLQWLYDPQVAACSPSTFWEPLVKNVMDITIDNKLQF